MTNTTKTQRPFIMRFALVMLLLAMVLVLILFASKAFAQDESSAGVGGDAVAPVQKKLMVKMKAKPLDPMVLSETPQELKLNIKDIPTLDKSMLKDVKFKGFIRRVEVDGQGISQVMLTGIEKDGETIKFNDDNAQELSIQSESDSNQLNPANAEFTFDADPQILSAALAKLEAALNEKQADDGNKDDEEEEQVIADQSGGVSAPQGSGKGNEQASQYQSPENFETSEEKAPVITSSTTTDGCEIKIDLQQKVAIVFEKTITLSDGSESGRTECTESLTRYPLQKSFASCTPSINLENKKATAQFIHYYVNGSAQRVDTGECQDDSELKFDIVEKFDNCAIFIDIAQRKAVPQARLVYENDKNQIVEARGCQNSESKEAVPMTQNFNQCGIVHDYTRNVSKQQGAWIYALDGSYYQASACVDTDTTYSHAQVYYNSAGAPICTPIVDQQSKTVTLSSRVAITVNGLQSFIKECTPDTDNRLNMTATTDGCTDPSTWTHNISTNQSFGKERYYYMLNNKREYVTQCIDSSTVYQHSSALAAYQYHDANLYAYPLYDIWITTSAGRHNIATSHLIPGTQQAPYTQTGFTDNPNGSFTYAGCDKTQATTRTTHYDRPDDSKYDVVGGNGTPLRAVYSCTPGNKMGFVKTSSVVNNQVGTQLYGHSTPYKTMSVSGFGSPCVISGNVSQSSPVTFKIETAKYKGQRQLNRDDGQKITETSTREFTKTINHGHFRHQSLSFTVSTVSECFNNGGSSMARRSVPCTNHFTSSECTNTYSRNSLSVTPYPANLSASDSDAVAWYSQLGW